MELVIFPTFLVEQFEIKMVMACDSQQFISFLAKPSFEIMTRSNGGFTYKKE
jgi:hypothetical protein